MRKAIQILILLIGLGASQYTLGAEINWRPGESLLFCESTGSAKPSCQEILSKNSLQDVTAVITGNFFGLGRESWLMAGDLYKICTIRGASRTAYCETIDFPVIPGLELHRTYSPQKNGFVLVGKFRTDLGIPKTAAITIVRAFSSKLHQSVETLTNRLPSLTRNPGKAIELNQDSGMKVVATVIGGDCFMVEPSSQQRSETAVSLSTSIGCTGGGSDWIDIPPDLGFGGFGPNPACEATCTLAYERASAYCRILPDPRARAVCWAAAAASYGTCLAKC